MNKKDLTMYETPTVEVLDIELENQMLAGTVAGNAEGIIEDVPEEDLG